MSLFLVYNLQTLANFLYSAQFLVGFLLSYYLYYFLASKTTGGYSYGQLKCTLCKKQVHFHHWCYCLVVFFCLSIWYPWSFCLGLCCGGIVHGLQYSDWYQICNNVWSFEEVEKLASDDKVDEPLFVE